MDAVTRRTDYAIKESIRAIRERIAEAADRSGRSSTEVTLIGVTKTVGVPEMREMIRNGVTHIGENRAQEIVSKYPQLTDDGLCWHMIGTMQKNKVRHIADKVNLIQSVDGVSLAMEIDKAGKRLNKRVPVLVEVNIAGEETKGGVKPEDAAELVKRIAELSNVEARGLMTIAPYTGDPQNLRRYFQRMRELFVDIKDYYDNVVDTDVFGVLSMGMTNDYAVAVEEGSTMVRIGTGIFGERL